LFFFSSYLHGHSKKIFNIFCVAPYIILINLYIILISFQAYIKFTSANVTTTPTYKSLVQQKGNTLFGLLRVV